MADLRSLPFPLRTFLRMYAWRRVDPVPWSPLPKPLSQANVALVTTAGIVAPGQPPFDQSLRGGDYSFRVIDSDADLATLGESHRSESFDRSGLERDLNLVLPLHRLRELDDAGAIGSFNRRVLSFMGSITAPGRLIRDTAPRAAALLVEDRVDAALLIPV